MPRLLRKVRVERIPGDEGAGYRFETTAGVTTRDRPVVTTYTSESEAAQALFGLIVNSWGDDVRVTYCGDAEDDA